MSKFRRGESWYQPASSFPTTAQSVAISDIITSWSILEIGMQAILFTLAQAPPALGQALTEDIGPDNRIKALKRLAHTWKAARHQQITPDHIQALDECLALATWVTKAKGRRNQIAHWAWLRSSDDEIFGFKYSTRPVSTYADPNNPPVTNTIETLEGLKQFAIDIEHAAERLSMAEKTLGTLPTLPHRRISISAEPERPDHSSQSTPLPPPQS